MFHKTVLASSNQQGGANCDFSIAHPLFQTQKVIEKVIFTPKKHSGEAGQRHRHGVNLQSGRDCKGTVLIRKANVKLETADIGFGSDEGGLRRFYATRLPQAGQK